MATPHVCPKCKGTKDLSCHPCSGSGIVWDREGDMAGHQAPKTPSSPLERVIFPYFPEPPNYHPTAPVRSPMNPDIVISWSRGYEGDLLGVVEKALSSRPLGCSL